MYNPDGYFRFQYRAVLLQKTSPELVVFLLFQLIEIILRYKIPRALGLETSQFINKNY
ncbi:hypothetical protein HMPREF1569_2879 [Klebsiella oxytoca OK-1]|nr:hypothetical protein HMPREF1569_2879 [Klebsiella oxytoca OK-1]